MQEKYNKWVEKITIRLDTLEEKAAKPEYIAIKLCTMKTEIKYTIILWDNIRILTHVNGASEES